jgi:hypothetical protein
MNCSFSIYGGDDVPAKADAEPGAEELARARRGDGR